MDTQQPSADGHGTTDPSALHGQAIVWDAHACLPLHADADITVLRRHLEAGATFVSVNIGMDMNPLTQVMPVIASFRAQLRARPDLFVPVDGVTDVRRAKAEGKLAVAFDLEGAVPLCERPEMVRLFWDLGVRQVHLAYNRNNLVAGGCYDGDAPLSPLGARIVEAVHGCGMLMDCSHMSLRSSLDVMALGGGPVIFSHANPRALKHDLRNVTDEQIDACAATGGVVCVNGVGRFLSDPRGRTPAMLDAIDYLLDRIGAGHVGLGIDYCYLAAGLDDDPPGLDRGFWWPSDFGYGSGLNEIKIAAPEQLPEITRGMLARGHAPATVLAVLGGNMLRLAETQWSATTCPTAAVPEPARAATA